MKMIIRPVKIEDSKFINEIRIMDGVRENRGSWGQFSLYGTESILTI